MHHDNTKQQIINILSIVLFLWWVWYEICCDNIEKTYQIRVPLWNLHIRSYPYFFLSQSKY
jgi:hypothetical protein